MRVAVRETEARAEEEGGERGGGGVSFRLTCELRHEGEGEQSKFPRSAPQMHGERRHTCSPSVGAD